MTIRILTHKDAQAYKELRLQALQKNPESFLATFEVENKKPINSFSSELIYAASYPIFGYYGVFIDEKLVGYAHLSDSYLPKQKHIAYLYNLYINPDYRNKGLAIKLFNHLLEEIKQTKIERIFLSCNKKNVPAQKLYKKLGFVKYGLKEKSVKWQDEYDDEVEMVKVV
jgi:ribosomal protein S18 acetylase RimI-like enzyme